MIAETLNTKGLFDKLKALPDGPIVPDRLVAVEKKVETLLSQNVDHSKNRATGDALAKTRKDVEALQNQIKKCLAIIDSQSQKVHDLEEENKAICAHFRDFQAEVKSNINSKLAAAMISLDSTIKSTETDIRSEVHSKIREVEKGLGESTNTLKAQVEKQKDRLSEQIPRIDELGQVADQVISKVASLFKRKSDEESNGRNENKRQRT
jgi:F0F1-type ATP synthase membrane subunit b/b'